MPESPQAKQCALALAEGTQTGVAAGQGGPSYEVTNLASLGGTSSAGSSINDRAWTAGFSTTKNGRELIDFIRTEIAAQL